MVDQAAYDTLEKKLTETEEEVGTLRTIIDNGKKEITRMNAEHTVALNEKNLMINKLTNMIKTLEVKPCENCARLNDDFVAYANELETYDKEVNRLKTEMAKLAKKLEFEKRITERLVSQPTPVQAPVAPATISYVPPTVTDRAPSITLGGRRSEVAHVQPTSETRITLGGRRTEAAPMTVAQTLTRRPVDSCIPATITRSHGNLPLDSQVPRSNYARTGYVKEKCVYTDSDGKRCTEDAVDGYDNCKTHTMVIARRIGIACATCESRGIFTPVGIDSTKGCLADICPECANAGQHPPAVSNIETMVPICTRTFAADSDKTRDYCERCLTQVNCWVATVKLYNSENSNRARAIPTNIHPQFNLMRALTNAGYRV